ncbi:response regulator [Microbacterium sp. YY-03]|uniref:response regulator n=1 Tax=Microbacterium sp. YY-03 TaxID=3421636 RepID=UPI003D16E535
MIRVVLVDDHAVMRAGFRMILTSTDDIEVVGEASTGREAIAIAHELQPDVICMDVQMPDMDGLEATRQIVADPAVGAAIVVVTTFDRDDYVFQALQAGASGFLLKNASPDELISAVRVAAAGDALLAPEVTKRVIERFAAESAGSSGAAGAGASGAVRAGASGASSSPSAASPGATTIDVDLTDREREVLCLLARALSNAEIAAELFIGEATVKSHVSNLLAKLGARDRVGAVVYAHRHGLA